MPLSLSDAELDLVMVACQPLLPEDRDEFLRAFARAMVRRHDVLRAIKEAQQAYFESPTLQAPPPRVGRAR